MKRLIITALASAALGTAAMAQAPVPNASGSQVTNPADIRNSKPNEGSMTGPGMSTQGPATTGSTMRPPPVPNASGSQVTNPADIRNSKPQ